MRGFGAAFPATKYPQQSTARFFDSGHRPVQDRRMQLVMRNIVDTCVRCGNRRALDGLRANRKGLIAVLTMLRGDPSKVIAQCEDELALIETGLATLDKAAAA